MLKEGQYHIPSGCAISGIFHKDGRRTDGTEIIRSISVMHDRSNGLGGGFAAYGIYPEYADCYAFHLFYDEPNVKDACEKFLNELKEKDKDGIITWKPYFLDDPHSDPKASVHYG